MSLGEHGVGGASGATQSAACGSLSPILSLSNSLKPRPLHPKNARRMFCMDAEVEYESGDATHRRRRRTERRSY